MNQFEETERLKMDRKLLKPQVERRRRERMNRSLENLRLLLLQGPEQQAVSQRRMEKAEILEHTVLFLQSSITEAKKPIAEDESSSDGHQFLDGFSACLQKAARFLQEQSETRGLDNSLSSSLHRCLSRRPHRPSVSDWRHIAQGLSVRRHSHTNTPTHPYRMPLQHTDPNSIRRHHNQNTARTPWPTTSPQATGKQSVWRPWP